MNSVLPKESVLNQDEFYALLKSLPLALLLVDRKGKLVYINDLALAFGHLHAGEVGQPFDDFFVSFQYESLFSHLVKGCVGDQQALRVTLSTQENGPGKRDQLLLFARGFENFILVQLERAPAVHTQDEFDPHASIGCHKTQLIGRLVGGIAHDFNNILGVLYGYLEMALDECVPQSVVTSYLKQVERSADKMRDLVQEILLLHHDGEDANRLLSLIFETKQVLKFIKSVLPSSIMVECNWPEVELSVWGNASHWRLIMLNIFLNAAESLPDGGTIFLKIKKTEIDAKTAEKLALKPGPFAMVLIQDSGLGMSPAVLRREFEPDICIKPVAYGNESGLKLALALVHKQGGAMSVISPGGNGLFVELYMPIAPPKQDSTPRS